MPRAIRGDHSVPCASAKAPCRLCERAVRPLRLGVAPERMASGHFWRTSEHERMPLVFEREALAVTVSAGGVTADAATNAR